MNNTTKPLTALPAPDMLDEVSTYELTRPPESPVRPPIRSQLMYPELEDEQYTNPSPFFLL